MRFNTFDEFMAYALNAFPDANVGENVDGELFIITGLSNDGENGVVPTSETY